MLTRDVASRPPTNVLLRKLKEDALFGHEEFVSLKNMTQAAINNVLFHLVRKYAFLVMLIVFSGRVSTCEQSISMD